MRTRLYADSQMSGYTPPSAANDDRSAPLITTSECASPSPTTTVMLIAMVMFQLLSMMSLTECQHHLIFPVLSLHVSRFPSFAGETRPLSSTSMFASNDLTKTDRSQCVNIMTDRKGVNRTERGVILR